MERGGQCKDYIQQISSGKVLKLILLINLFFCKGHILPEAQLLLKKPFLHVVLDLLVLPLRLSEAMNQEDLQGFTTPFSS